MTVKESWLSCILPDDEYKAQRIVYFLGEGALFMLGSLGFLLIGTQVFSAWNIPIQLLAGIPIILFVAYVFIRYIVSGIEYTNVMSERAFEKEKKRIVVKSISFIVLFPLLYVLFLGWQAFSEKSFDVAGIVLISGVLMFLAEYISLKRSYAKNKELLD
jgi:predicted exporter